VALLLRSLRSGASRKRLVSPVSELRRLIVNWPFGTRRLVKSHKRVFVPSEHRRVLVQRVRSWSLAGMLGSAALFQPGAVAEPVAVRHMEGTVHGFLVLRTVEGKALAAGDLTQVVQGDRLVSRLISYQVIAAHFLPVRRPSSIPETPDDDSVVLSEIAHIVARKTDGPRGHDPLPLDERDRFENLILPCEEHHHVVDSQPQFYSVARLTQFKHDHEDHIARTVQKLACAELSGGAVIVIKHSAEAASASNESVVMGETAIGNDE
jgi:hypothetical protein